MTNITIFNDHPLMKRIRFLSMINGKEPYIDDFNFLSYTVYYLNNMEHEHDITDIAYTDNGLTINFKTEEDKTMFILKHL